MPALPYIAAAVSAAGAINQNNQANTAADLSRSQVELDAEKYGWTKEQTEAELNRRLGSANKYWEDYNSSGEPVYQDEITRATDELTPLYDEQSKETIQNLGTSQMARGFYGQLPGDIQTQEAIAKLEAAKNQAITSQANTNYQTGLAQRLAEKQIGLNTFGTYGETEIPSITPSVVEETGGSGTVETIVPEEKKKVAGGRSFNGGGQNGGGWGYNGGGQNAGLGGNGFGSGKGNTSSGAYSGNSF